jgi:hypothetical protein
MFISRLNGHCRQTQEMTADGSGQPDTINDGGGIGSDKTEDLWASIA